MVFDIEMEDFQCMAHLVAVGPVINAHTTMTYTSVISCETVHLALTIAALNDLKVKVSNVLNAYITALIAEKLWTTMGPEIGEDQDKNALIV